MTGGGTCGDTSLFPAGVVESDTKGPFRGQERGPTMDGQRTWERTRWDRLQAFGLVAVIATVTSMPAWVLALAHLLP